MTKDEENFNNLIEGDDDENISGMYLSFLDRSCA